VEYGKQADSKTPSSTADSHLEGKKTRDIPVGMRTVVRFGSDFGPLDTANRG